MGKSALRRCNPWKECRPLKPAPAGAEDPRNQHPAFPHRAKVLRPVRGGQDEVGRTGFHGLRSLEDSLAPPPGAWLQAFAPLERGGFVGWWIGGDPGRTLAGVW